MAYAVIPKRNPGDAILASDQNQIVDNFAVLALRLIKTQTIGSGVTSVEVTGAFSADYDNYLITVTNMDSSGTNGDFFIRLGTSTTRTEYQYAHTVCTTGAVREGYGAINTANGMSVGYFDDDETNFAFMLMAPFLAQPTTMHSVLANQTYAGVAGGWDGLASSHTQFVLRVGAGTITGGEIRVYGYINS